MSESPWILLVEICKISRELVHKRENLDREKCHFNLLLAAILWLGVSDNSIADETESDTELKSAIAVLVGNTQNGSETEPASVSSMSAN
jgi:hypothetical protein